MNKLPILANWVDEWKPQEVAPSKKKTILALPIFACWAVSDAWELSNDEYERWIHYAHAYIAKSLFDMFGGDVEFCSKEIERKIGQVTYSPTWGIGQRHLAANEVIITFVDDSEWDNKYYDIYDNAATAAYSEICDDREYG